MFEALTDDLLDLRASERGDTPFADGAPPAFPVCCSIAISLCSSCSSRVEAE